MEDITTTVPLYTDFFENVTYDTILNDTVTSPSGIVHTSIPSSKYVSFAVTIFFMAVGLFGNSCTVVIMTKQKDTYNAHGLYLTALAIADIKSLLVVTLNKPLMIDIFGVDIRAFTETGCKLFKYIGRAAVICSSYFVVLICIERFIAIWFPLKMKFLLSKKKASISICAIFMTIYLVNIPCVVFTGNKDGICLPDFALEPDRILPKINSIMTWILHTMIPTIVLVILTPLTVGQLYRQKMIRRQLGDQKRQDVTNRITVMLISIVMSYFVLICISSIIFWVLTLNGVNILKSSSPWAKTFRDVYETAELMNYSLNFLLYVVTSADFRRQISQLFRAKSSRSQVYRTNEVTFISDSRQENSKDHIT